MPKQPKPSVRSIAASLNVSPITVSRVLSGSPSVSQETRDRVLDEVNKVGYDFFNRSKILRQERDTNVVIHCGEDKLLQDRIFGFYSDLYYRCVKRLHAEGFHAYLVNYDEHPEIAFEAQDSAGNLILLGPIAEARFAEIRARYPKLSIVSFGGNVHDVLEVGCSDFIGGALAAEQLFAFGHRRVAMPSPLNEQITRKRYGGFYATFLALGGEVDGLPFWGTGNRNGDDPMLEKLISDYLKNTSSDRRATAFFCPQGYTAFFLMQYFAKVNISVPKDFSLVTYDNFEMFDHTNPPLARVWFSTKDLVIQIVEALIKFRNSPAPLPASIEIAPIFTMNQSLAFKP